MQSDGYCYDVLSRDNYSSTPTTTSRTTKIRYSHKSKSRLISSLVNLFIIIVCVFALHALEDLWIRLCCFAFDWAFSRHLGHLSADRIFGFLCSFQGLSRNPCFSIEILKFVQKSRNPGFSKKFFRILEFLYEI